MRGKMQNLQNVRKHTQVCTKKAPQSRQAPKQQIARDGVAIETSTASRVIKTIHQKVFGMIVHGSPTLFRSGGKSLAIATHILNLPDNSAYYLDWGEPEQPALQLSCKMRHDMALRLASRKRAGAAQSLRVEQTAQLAWA